MWRRTISTGTASTARCSCPSSSCCRRRWTWCGSMRAPISGWKSWCKARSGMCRPTMPRDAQLDHAWSRMTLGQPPLPMTLTVKGHKLHVPQAAMGAARFGFPDLCVQPLGSADFIRLAHEFHTLVIDDIPVMRFGQRNEAKRFIILIDTLYDNAVKLIASADGAAARALSSPTRARAVRIPAHGVAADRDGIADLSRAAAWPRRLRGQRDRAKASSRPDRRGQVRAAWYCIAPRAA